MDIQNQKVLVRGASESSVSKAITNFKYTK